MNKRELFRDVLSEGAVPDFEETVFRKTVATAKRVRRTRVALRSGLVALVIAFFAFQSWPRREIVVVTDPSSPKAVVASHKTLETRPFANIIRTEPIEPVRLVASTSNRVSIVSTAEAGAGTLRFINDEELLALFEGKAVALVHRGGGGADLIFVGNEK